jgi:hypothetical protein
VYGGVDINLFVGQGKIQLDSGRGRTGGFRAHASHRHAASNIDKSTSRDTAQHDFFAACTWVGMSTTSVAVGSTEVFFIFILDDFDFPRGIL